ncbi:MAG: DUF2793 domain-containing protein [Pseudomonadota bacterium]
MANTANLGLPLVASAQSQKHITVNESLLVLDSLLQGSVTGFDLIDPPATPEEGTVYHVGLAATGDWAGHGGQLAFYANQGWRFITPRTGWRLYDAAQGGFVRYVNGNWVHELTSVSVEGAGTAVKTVVHDHVVSAGSTNQTDPILPNHGHVLAVSGRIISEITADTGSDWQLGVTGSDNRYGSGLGFAAGSYVKGLTGTGVSYYAPTPLLLTCNGGVFTGGTIRFAIHYIDFDVPA